MTTKTTRCLGHRSEYLAFIKKKWVVDVCFYEGLQAFKFMGSLNVVQFQYNLLQLLDGLQKMALLYLNFLIN